HPVEAVGERDPRARDGCGARTAVGLDHVAIERDLPFAERRQVNHRAQAPADQPLDLDGTPALFTSTGFAPRSFGRRAREHAVFRGNPATSLALEPGWEPLFQACRHQAVGIAEFNETGAFGVFNHAALE